MLLTVRDVAQVLHVEENTVERWATESGLPAMRIGGQYRFNRTELLEWATIRQMAIDPEVFHLSEGEPDETAGLADALERGGIRRAVAAEQRAALEEVVAGFSLPGSCDREELRQLIAARGAATWTFIGHGIAVPHPRYPVVMPIDKPLLQLCFLDWKIQLGESAQASVDTLFVLLSPTVRTHLTLTALLCGALADGRFSDVVTRKASPEVILGEARRFNGDYHGNNTPKAANGKKGSA